MLIVVCVVVVWLCGCVVLAQYFLPILYSRSPNPCSTFSPNYHEEVGISMSPQAALTDQHTMRIRQRISKLGWQLGLAFILRGENMHFLCSSVRYSGRIGS